MGTSKSLHKLLSSAAVLPALMLATPVLQAQQNTISTETERSLGLQSSKQRLNVRYNAYILGAGDQLQIELLDLPELSGAFTIGPDGTLYLPRLRALQVEGLTIEELRLNLQ